MVRLLKPWNLDQALRLARFHEQSIGSGNKKGAAAGGQSKTGHSTTFQAMTSHTPSGATDNKVPMLTQSKIDQTLHTKPRPQTCTQREERKGIVLLVESEFCLKEKTSS